MRTIIKHIRDTKACAFPQAVPLWNTLWPMAAGPQSFPKLPETAAMREDVLLTSKGPSGCCYSECSLHIHPEMMGLMMSLLWQFVPGVRGLTLKLGEVEGGQ